jgi:hypothetical protein
MRCVRTAIALVAAVSLSGATLGAYSAGRSTAPLWKASQASKLLAANLGAPGPWTSATWAYTYGYQTLSGDGQEALQASEGGGPMPEAVAIHSSCRGLGKPQSKEYGAFKCTVAWIDQADQASPVYTTRVWVRLWTPPWTPMFCASTRMLADCPPAPPRPALPGDPRVCSFGANPLGCILDTAEQAVITRVGGPLVNSGCVAVATWVYTCTWEGNGGAHATAEVRFVQGKTRWTTTVTLAP